MLHRCQTDKEISETVLSPATRSREAIHKRVVAFGFLFTFLYLALGFCLATAQRIEDAQNQFVAITREFYKRDWTAVQDLGGAAGSAISFLFVEDDAGRMARAVAVYDQFKEIKAALAGVRVSEIPAMAKQLASTLTRDLYTDAEASLGWAPITAGLDFQVVNYMAGITTGYVGEQVAVGVATGAAAVKITAKIGPVFKGLVAAVKSGSRYTLEMLDDAAKASAKLEHGIVRLGRSREEVRAATHAAQKAKLLELPGGIKVPQVIDNWFKLKPQLYDDLLKIWADKLPANVSDQRLTHMINDLAQVLHRYGNATDFPDDAVKGFAHLQAKLFKTGEDSLSRWKDCEKLFGGLDTAARRTALQESLVAYKQAVEVDTEAAFIIKKITSIQPMAYRYNSRVPDGGWAGFSGQFSGNPDGYWCTFDLYDNKYIATDRLLLPLQSSAPLYRYEFATSEVVEKSRIPRGFGDTESFFEPLTRDKPDDFIGAGTSIQGKATQFKATDVPVIQRVIDMNTGLQVWP